MARNKVTDKFRNYESRGKGAKKRRIPTLRSVWCQKYIDHSIGANRNESRRSGKSRIKISMEINYDKTKKIKEDEDKKKREENEDKDKDKDQKSDEDKDQESDEDEDQESDEDVGKESEKDGGKRIRK